MGFPLEKWIFWTWKNSVFCSQNRFFFSLQRHLALFVVLFWANENKEKMAFFRQKHGLTPLKKKGVSWTLKNSLFYSEKRFLSFLQSNKALFVVLFWPNPSRKIWHFWPKSWVNPFEKNTSFWSLKTPAIYSQKSFFFLFKVIKHYFQSSFDQI